MYEMKCFLNAYLTVAQFGQLKSVIPEETANIIIHVEHLNGLYIVNVVLDGLPLIEHPYNFVWSKNCKKELRELKKLKEFGEMDFEELGVGDFPMHYFKIVALFLLVVLMLEVIWE